MPLGGWSGCWGLWEYGVSSGTGFEERGAQQAVMPPLPPPPGQRGCGPGPRVHSARWVRPTSTAFLAQSLLLLHARHPLPCPISRRPWQGPACSPAAPAAVPATAPRCLCSPAAASPEFTHIPVKALQFVWGLETRSARMLLLCEVLSPSRPAEGPEAAGGVVGLQLQGPLGALRSLLQCTEGETEAQRGKWQAGIPPLALELGVGSMLAFALLQLWREAERNREAA